jgi:glutamine synthetase
VTVLFSDLEGRLHMLDYDKKFLIKSWDNLTFDGSSIRGFTAQRESDLRLGIDWTAFTGAGGLLGACWCSATSSTGRPVRRRHSRHSSYAAQQFKDEGYTLNAANEIEGFLFKEWTRSSATTKPASLREHGGYYHSLPGDPLYVH